MAHVVLLPHGTAGSIYPFVAVGRMLKERGHRVTMVTADRYAHTAASAGLAFRGIGDEALAALLADPQLWRWRTGAKVSYRCAGRSTCANADAVARLVAEDGMPDLMLAPMINFGARLARERWGIPLVTVHLCPMMFVTASSVPLFGPEAHALRRLPRVLRRIALHSPNPLDVHALSRVRACCARYGVPKPYSLWEQWWHSPDGVLALFPSWVAASQPDWPSPLLQWDFPLEDMADAEPLAPELRAFLDRGDPPVVFTPGTGQRHAAPFFAEAVRLVREAGVRAVFLSREPSQIPRDLPDTICTAAYAPFSRLLPYAAAFVHHGGIGTLAQGLAAGVPQLVTAMSLDQPDNAERLTRLGAGVATSLRAFVNGRSLPMLRRVLDDPAIRAAAATCAERMRERPSPGALVDWLESRQLPSRRARRASVRGSPVYVVPGLGCDSRCYPGAWIGIPNAVFLEWPPYAGEASITALAKHVADAWRIPDGAVVVACSFGGAIACEIARLRTLRAVVLVCSSPNSRDFVGMRRLHFWKRLAPLAFIQRFLRQRESVRRRRYGRDPSAFEAALLSAIEQFSVCDLRLFECMVDAFPSWQGLAQADTRTRIARVHGRHDSLVRPPAKADLLLDAGHFVPMTHDRECADFVSALVASE